MTVRLTADGDYAKLAGWNVTALACSDSRVECYISIFLYIFMHEMKWLKCLVRVKNLTYDVYTVGFSAVQ